MPKQVDHEARRGDIAAAVCRIAQREGLASVSFREVAAEAEMSASLLQHYVGTKQELLELALRHTSEAVGGRIVARLASLGDAADPLAQLAAICEEFLPGDRESRAAMQVYLQFSAAAMADAELRSTDAFANGYALIDTIAGLLRQLESRDELRRGVEPDLAGLALLSVLLGLSTAVLLGQASPREAMAALDAHLRGLVQQGPAR